MAGADAAGAEERRWRSRRRAALLLWTAFAVMVWNIVFDAAVVQAGREYLTRQALHQQGRGPAVTIREVMHPEVARAAKVATLSGGAVAGGGLLAVWVAARRRRAAALPPRAE